MALPRHDGIEQTTFSRLGAKLKGFEEIVVHQANRLKQHAQVTAERDDVERGLVCVLGTVEPVQAFRLAHGEGRPRLLSQRRKCLVYYFYLIDSECGFMHDEVLAHLLSNQGFWLSAREGLTRRWPATTAH